MNGPITPAKEGSVMTRERQQREQRESASAGDILEHPGWSDILRDVVREARAARSVLFSDIASEREQSFARGSLAVLKNIVLAVSRRANKEVPPQVTALFE